VSRKWKNWYQTEVDEEIVLLQRHGEAYQKERSAILRVDDAGGQARVTTDEERVLRGR